MVLFSHNHLSPIGGKKVQINEYISVEELGIGRYLMAAETVEDGS